MQYKGTLITVKDREKSIQFYHDILGLEVLEDFGANIVLSGGVFLQTTNTWKKFIAKNEDQILFYNNAIELYFEEKNIDEFVKKLEGYTDIEYVHTLIEHGWGQRAVRFYDPDGHIIEVGENMVAVVERFIKNGLSVEETAKRMDVSTKYIQSLLNG